MIVAVCEKCGREFCTLPANGRMKDGYPPQGSKDKWPCDGTLKLIQAKGDGK